MRRQTATKKGSDTNLRNTYDEKFQRLFSGFGTALTELAATASVDITSALARYGPDSKQFQEVVRHYGSTLPGLYSTAQTAGVNIESKLIERLGESSATPAPQASPVAATPRLAGKKPRVYRQRHPVSDGKDGEGEEKEVKYVYVTQRIKELKIDNQWDVIKTSGAVIAELDSGKTARAKELLKKKDPNVGKYRFNLADRGTIALLDETIRDHHKQFKASQEERGGGRRDLEKRTKASAGASKGDGNGSDYSPIIEIIKKSNPSVEESELREAAKAVSELVVNGRIEIKGKYRRNHLRYEVLTTPRNITRIVNASEEFIGESKKKP